MADINFLPSDSKPEQKEEKKIRRVEYTNPAYKKKQKSTQHGGILSIFSKKTIPGASTPPPPPPPKEKPVEPTLTKKEEKKEKATKTVITYQEPEKEKHKEKTKPKKQGNFFTRLFSRSEKPKAQLPAPPPPDVPSYEAKPYEPEKPKPKEHEKMFGKVSRETVIKDDHAAGDAQDRPMRVPPPFSPFGAKPPVPQKPMAPDQKNEVIETKPPQMHTPESPASATKEEGQPRQTAPIPARPGLMFDVNLVPDELAQKKRSLSKLTWLALIVVISIAFVGVSYFGIAFYKEGVASEAERLEDGIERIKQQIKVLEPIQLDALVLQKRTEEISRLLDTHIYWTQFFEKLETYTLKQIDVTDVRANKDGTVTIVAQASDPKFAYEQLSVFEAADDFVSSVSLVPPTLPVVITEETQVIDDGNNFLFPLPGTEEPGATEPVSRFTFQIQMVPGVLYSTNEL